MNSKLNIQLLPNCYIYKYLVHYSKKAIFLLKLITNVSNTLAGLKYIKIKTIHINIYYTK